MDDFFEDDYQDYLASYQAWGHEHVDGRPLDFDAWYDLRNEREELDILEDCRAITKNDRARREQVQRLLLEHESFYEDGPRVIVTLPAEED